MGLVAYVRISHILYRQNDTSELILVCGLLSFCFNPIALLSLLVDDSDRNESIYYVKILVTGSGKIY